MNKEDSLLIDQEVENILDVACGTPVEMLDNEEPYDRDDDCEDNCDNGREEIKELCE